MRRLHTRIVRFSSYSVAAVLSVGMASAVLPPLTADQSDRAVVDAPIVLLTAPIEGEIQRIAVRPGQTIETRSVAEVVNGHVDDTTLVTLEEKSTSVRERILAARQKQRSDAHQLASLDEQIAAQRDQLIKQMQGQVLELRARIAQSEAGAREKKARLDHQSGMLARDVVSSDMVRPTEQQYEAALHYSEAERAKLQQKEAQLQAVRDGLFVGDDLAVTAALVQKRRDLELDSKRQAIEEDELAAGVADRDRLIDAERNRVTKLSRSEVLAPTGLRVLHVSAGVGQRVHAGDTLASAVDCTQRVIVAIFSYRQGQNLTVGTPVTIEGGTFSHGTVKAVLPKTSDKMDERFAVPFPQTERRELYVLVQPDRGAEDEQAEDSDTSVCGVGQWLTVRRDGGWLPSTSILWRRLQRALPAFAPEQGAVNPPRRSSGPENQHRDPHA